MWTLPAIAGSRTWGAMALALGLAQARAFAAQPLPPPLPPAPPQALTVATLHLGLEPEPWLRQRERIVATLQRLRPDVIALQDVRQSPDLPNQACWLAARLDYSCSFITADPPSRAQRSGNALLARQPVVSDAVTLLHPFAMASTAGMVQLDIGGRAVNIYVTRLFDDAGQAPADAAAIRAAQVQNLLRWITATAGDAPSLLLGDMAAPGDAPELRGLAPHYLHAGGHADGSEQVFVQPPLRAVGSSLLLETGNSGDSRSGVLVTIALPQPQDQAAEIVSH